MAKSMDIRIKIIEKLTYEPAQVMNGIINIKDAATFPSPRVSEQLCPLGKLEILPLELLHLVFMLLDIQALLRVRRSCKRGFQVVDSLPEFNKLTEHAAEALTALGKTRLLRFHSTTELYAALLAHECVSCGEFGPFLFLPTCERCCYNCLYRNQSLWVIPLALAKKAFDVSSDSLNTLPIMRSIPGSYCVGFIRSRKRPIRLVSVKAVKKLVLRQGRSEQMLLSHVDSLRRLGTYDGEYHEVRYLVRAPMSPLRKFLLRPYADEDTTDDKFCGMAAVSFPSIFGPGDVQKGLWCQGCSETHRLYESELHWRDVSHLVEKDDPLARWDLHALKFLPRSEADFFEHLPRCPGSRRLVPDLPEMLRLASYKSP